MNDVLSMDTLPITEGDDGELRCRDLDLAERLGYRLPRQIRELIRRRLRKLEAFGPVVCRTVRQTPKGGRPGKEYHLNRKQAIYLAAKSLPALPAVETPQADFIGACRHINGDRAKRSATPQVKASLPHGSYLPWLEKHGIAPRTAQRLVLEHVKPEKREARQSADRKAKAEKRKAPHVAHLINPPPNPQPKETQMQNAMSTLKTSAKPSSRTSKLLRLVARAHGMTAEERTEKVPSQCLCSDSGSAPLPARTLRYPSIPLACHGSTGSHRAAF